MGVKTVFPFYLKTVFLFSLKTVFLFSLQAGLHWDYWADDFDTNKNCQQEKKIIELDNLPTSQCAKEMVSFLNVHT